MKKRALTIILIVQSVLLIAAIVATVLLWPSIWRLEDPDSVPATVILGTDSDVHNGYADVTLYGAVPDDGKDDTDAFINAAKTGAGVYVPLGIYDIKETVILRGQNLKGSGMDRTVIRFNGEGTIVKMKGAAMLDDITLTFAEGSITGNEAEGQQVAVFDEGITNGAMLRSVRVTNVGTGYYSSVDAPSDLTFTAESFIVDKFSHKAIQIKDAFATMFRTTKIGEAVGEVDAAVSLGGQFTLDLMTFSGTKCSYPIELNNCESAVINSLVFDSTTPTSGSFIKSVSSYFSMRAVTVKGSKASAVVSIEDTAEGGETVGNIISLWSNSGSIVTDAENRIKCDSIVSQ